MGQGEVINILEKKKCPLSAKEISELIDESFTLVSHCIARLIKSREIKIIELSREEAVKRFNGRYKRRMRLYYC